MPPAYDETNVTGQAIIKRHGVDLGRACEFVDPVSQTAVDLKGNPCEAQMRISGNDYRMFIVRSMQAAPDASGSIQK